MQPDADTWIARLGTLPLVAEPGERWLYNTGASVHFFVGSSWSFCQMVHDGGAFGLERWVWLLVAGGSGRRADRGRPLHFSRNLTRRSPIRYMSMLSMLM